VYSVAPPTAQDQDQDQDRPWAVGFKRAWDAESPGLLHRVRAGDSYYMLGSFNETHRHCVLLGDGPRYAVPMWNADLRARQGVECVRQQSQEALQRCAQVRARVRMWLRGSADAVDQNEKKKENMEEKEESTQGRREEEAVDGDELAACVQDVLRWQNAAALDWLPAFFCRDPRALVLLRGSEWWGVMHAVRRAWQSTQAHVEVWLQCLGNYLVPSEAGRDVKLCALFCEHLAEIARAQQRHRVVGWAARTAWAAVVLEEEEEDPAEQAEPKKEKEQEEEDVFWAEWSAVRRKLQWQCVGNDDDDSDKSNGNGHMLANAEVLCRTIDEWRMELG
jgi:hypothetical protein